MRELGDLGERRNDNLCTLHARFQQKPKQQSDKRIYSCCMFLWSWFFDGVGLCIQGAMDSGSSWQVLQEFRGCSEMERWKQCVPTILIEAFDISICKPGWRA